MSPGRVATRIWIAFGLSLIFLAVWELCDFDADAQEPAVEVSEGLAAARKLWQEGQRAEASQQLDALVKKHPEDARVWAFRGSLRAAQGQSAEALKDFTAAIELQPQRADLYNARGMEAFKLAKITESITDFDAAIARNPSLEPGHWQRGISYYYAERFADGRKQFEGYQDVDDSDVENAVWRYLCMARSDSPAAAQKAILKIGPDRRVPMREIYELFAGNSTPEAVLKAVEADMPAKEELNQRQFYAHLYLGLYYEAQREPVRSQEHLRQAVDHRIGHYMWDVARVHHQLRQPR